MSFALLIVDLEGITGVDDLDALVGGTAAYAAARRALAREIDVVVRGLLDAGHCEVRISDSHQSGLDAPNVLRHLLHPRATLLDIGDAYAPELISEADAVACLGMHAAAGGEGFAAHTVDLHCGWRCSRRWLSETDIVLAIAAEAGTPVVFVSGDDALATSLGEDVRYVCTKRSIGLYGAVSRDPKVVRGELATAASSPATTPASMGDRPWTLTFKSRVAADIAEAEGASRLDGRTVKIEGASVAECYQRAAQLVTAAGQPMMAALRGEPGDAELLEDITAILGRKLTCEPPQIELPQVSALLDAFRRLSCGEGDEARALRALVLTVTKNHAPAAFDRLDLGRELTSALDALGEVSRALTPGLDPDLAMARLDASWLEWAAGRVYVPLDRDALAGYVAELHVEGDWLYAWLLAALARDLGVDVPCALGPRALRDVDRLGDLYWVTHELLLDTGYLARPIDTAKWAAELETLLIAVSWIIEQGHVDLAAEVLVCLQASGEGQGPEAAALWRFVEASIGADGAVCDASMDGDASEMADHATGLALIAAAYGCAG